MIYTKYMPGRTLQHASRNKRELQAAREVGFDIQVISSDDDIEFADTYPDYKLISDRVEKLNYGMSRAKRYLLIGRNFITSIFAIRKTTSDIISCHDLNSLFKGWLSTLFKKNKPKLIYDSHEFELGRNTGKKRSGISTWRIAHMERFLMKKCAFSIMVNDSIADEVQRIHKLKERPIVVRSTPNYWEIDESVCQQRRSEFMSAFSEMGGYPTS